MSGELLAAGDPVPHRHELPEIPRASVPKFVGVWIAKDFVLENAVARCGTCGRLFVSRVDPEGWGRVVCWVPLRWWHRTARRKLREQEAGRW